MASGVPTCSMSHTDQPYSFDALQPERIVLPFKGLKIRIPIITPLSRYNPYKTPIYCIVVSIFFSIIYIIIRFGREDFLETTLSSCRSEWTTEICWHRHEKAAGGPPDGLLSDDGEPMLACYRVQNTTCLW